MMKKILSLCLIFSMLLQPIEFACAETYKDYKAIIDDVVKTYGAFEENVNFYATGLIYGELIDFDNDDVKELMLIYKKNSTNTPDSPWANILVYGMKGNVPVKLLDEEIHGSLGQTDMGAKIYIRDIDGKKHLLFNSKLTYMESGQSENMIVFFMQNKNVVIKKYYGEGSSWWDSFNYTKCMIDNREVSAEKYTDSLNQYYTNSLRLNLMLGNDFDNYVFCSKKKYEKFISEVKTMYETKITGFLCERIHKDRFGNSESYLILKADNSKVGILTETNGRVFEIASGDEIQLSIKGYSPEMIGARVKIKSYEDVFEAHSSYHMRPVVVLNAEIEILQKPINVLLDGEKVEFDYPPVIINGRTMVPLRAIFEKLGATVEWDGNTKTVTATNEHNIISLSIGKTEMYKNGQLITLDVAAQLVGGRTLVPIRAVVEGFGCKVEWQEETRTVLIVADVFKELTDFASNLCSVIETKLGGTEYFNQAIAQNEYVYCTLNELDDSIDFKETVLTIEGELLKVCEVVLKYATGNIGGAAKEIAGALVSNGADVMFAALKEMVPDMQSFIYNLGVTACQQQNEDLTNLNTLHLKMKSGEYTESDVVSYVYLYYQMMINNENSKLSVRLLQNELPEGFGESLGESLKTAVGVFMPSVSGDLLDLDLPSEVMLSILEEYASFACGEANDFYAQMIKNINDPAIEEWAENVQSYTNALTVKLSTIK